MPDPFITTSDVVNFLGRGGTADAGIIIATDAACDICRDVASQTFNVGTSTIFLDGSGTDSLLLPELPVSAAGTVVVAGGTVSDYVLATDTGILFRKQVTSDIDYTNSILPLRWPAGRQNVQVTYDHGYASADLPRSVRMVALAIASRLVIQGPALEETVGESRIKYAVASTDLTEGERRILSRHGRRR